MSIWGSLDPEIRGRSAEGDDRAIDVASTWVYYRQIRLWVYNPSDAADDGMTVILDEAAARKLHAHLSREIQRWDTPNDAGRLTIV